MTCVHLQKLYKLCQTHDLKLGGADLIHIICHECGEKEVCPSGLMDELPDEDCVAYDSEIRENHFVHNTTGLYVEGGNRLDLVGTALVTLGLFSYKRLAVEMFPNVESSQPGTNIGRSRSAAAHIQLSLGSIW